MLEGSRTGLKNPKFKKMGFQFLHGLAQLHHRGNIYWFVYLLFIIFIIVVKYKEHKIHHFNSF